MTDLDNNIKKILHDSLPNTPESPWFTRKVLNRLPERKSNRGAIIEYCGFLIGAVVLLYMWIEMLSSNDATTHITIGDVINYISLVVLTISLIIGFLTTQLRKL